jgi:hypothetical protein
LSFGRLTCVPTGKCCRSRAAKGPKASADPAPRPLS